MRRWRGWPVGGLGGRLVVLPPARRVENAKKTIAGAPRQATEASGPTPSGHAQLAALLHARAHIPHRARTAGVARRRPWNSRVREAKQQEPTSATTGTSAACVVRLACAACMRGAACAAARRAASACCARACLCRSACAQARGRRTRHRDLPPTSIPVCVRACGLACAKSPRLARCTPPRSCSSASRDRADRAATHLNGAEGRVGRSAVTSTG